MKVKTIINLLLLTALISCSNKTNKINIVELSNLKSNDGWFDIPLTITDTKELDKYYEFNVKGLLNKDTIGIKIKLKKNIPSGFVNGEPKNMFLENGIEFISNGIMSNKLLMFMSSKYDVKSTNIKLKERQVFTCANLNQSKPNYNNGESRFKIFLEGDKEYAELFVNFNFSKKIISLNEKDAEYREQLINLLKE